MPPERFGLFFGVNAFGIIAASQINRWLAQPSRRRAASSRVVLPVALMAGVVLLVDACNGLRRIRRHPRAAVLSSSRCTASCMPNTTALAMAPHGSVAGSASALLGTLQFVSGRDCGRARRRARQRHGVPLAAVIAGCARGGLFTATTLQDRRSAVSPSAGVTSAYGRSARRTLVTNCGSASNSSARIVVITAVGIDDCSTPA